MPSRRPSHTPSAGRSSARARAAQAGANRASRAAATRSGARRPSVKAQRVGSRTPASLSSGPGLGALGAGPGGGSGKTLLTRRNFLYGAAAVGGVAVLAAGGAVLAGAAGGEGGSDDIAALTVPASSVTVLSADSEAFTQTPDTTPLAVQAGSYDLPFGTLVWSNNDVNAACLMPTETASPLATVGIMTLANGTVATVLPQAQDAAAGFEIYDARCNEAGLVWTEANILQGVWRVWAAPLSGTTLGTPVQLDQGDSAWETPSIAAAGTSAFWQCAPKASGAAETASSCVKRAAFGGQSVEVVCESTARMATPLLATQDMVVCTPRAEEAASYTRLTCIDAESGSIVDTLTLPSGMRPMEAGYGSTGFTFCFEAGYDFGDGISGVGTYTPTSAGSTGYDGLPWFCFSRTPITAPAWCGPFFVVKSTSSVAVIDLEARTYTSILADDNADDWGEQLASTGAGNVIVTYQHIDNGSSDSEEESTASKVCRVRVWNANTTGATVAAENTDGSESSDGSNDADSTDEADGSAGADDGSDDPDASTNDSARSNGDGSGGNAGASSDESA